MLSAKQVEPGKAGEIQVSIATEGLTAVNKTVIVTSNDPQNRQILLGITAAVQREFTLSQRMIFFENVPAGKEAAMSVVITVSADNAVKLLSAESTDTSFAARLDPVEGSGGKQVRLTGTMKADAKEGYHFGMLLVKTSSSFTPELKIPVRGWVVAPQNN